MKVFFNKMWNIAKPLLKEICKKVIIAIAEGIYNFFRNRYNDGTSTA